MRHLPQLFWLRTKRDFETLDEFVPCQHSWFRVGIHKNRWIAWCCKCGGIRLAHRDESEGYGSALSRVPMIWDFKCRRNPKLPRYLVTPRLHRTQPEEAGEESA
jgi:hypothetical protein